MQRSLKNAVVGPCLRSLIGVCTLLCLEAITPSSVLASGKPAVKHSAADSISNQDIIATLHCRGVDPNKYLRRASATKYTKPAFYPSPSKPLTVPQLALLALPSVVRLTVLDAQGVPSVQGSGFVVGENLIATNWHVVKAAHAVTANFQSGRSETVDGLVNCDIARDLVILHANTAGVRPLPLASGTAQVGDSVVAVGSPEGLGGSLSTGIVSALRLYNGARTIQTTAPISHGSSGGALLDVYGRVLGVTSFFVTDGQNLNFAYSSYHLRQLLITRRAGFMAWREVENYAHKPRAVAGLLPNAPSPAPANAASEGVSTDKPLTGLKGVWVCIENIDPDAKKDGLDPDQLKVAVELRLHKAGITVFDKINSDGNDSMATLDVNVKTSKDDSGLYRYSLLLNVTESVNLLRPTKCVTDATTWSTLDYGTVGASKMAPSLCQEIDDQVSKFANDYLAQNPK